MLCSRRRGPVHPGYDPIPHEQLQPIRLDIVSSIVTALGVAPRAKRLRERITAALSARAAEPIDRLETSARACGRAHALHLTTLNGSDVEQMVTELSRTRRVLMLEVEGLVAKKRLSASVLGEIVGGTGYKAMCLDVLQLVSALRADWAAIESHTPVTSLELDRAEALANAVATAIGENEQASSTSESAELRQRAYTHFVRTYEEVRRVVHFIRWNEDDADDFVPSLFAGRTRRREDDVIAPVVPPVVNLPVGPLPVVVAPNGSPTNGGGPISPDLPGAPPFVQS